MRISEALIGVGAPIAYHSNLARCFKSVKAAIFFAQIFYWQGRAQSPLGVYKSSEEIEEETALSYKEQKTARDVLTRLGVLIETHKRLEHRIYFAVDCKTLDEVFANWTSAKEDVRPMNKQSTPEMPNGQLGAGPKVISLISTETTTETTNKEKKKTPPLPPKGGGVDSEFSKGFLEFWEAWPRSERKQAKGQCYKSWKKAKAESHAAEIIKHVEACKESAGWSKDNGQYIPAPLVYLNQRRWEGAEDEPESLSAASRYGSGFEGVL